MIANERCSRLRFPVIHPGQHCSRPDLGGVECEYGAYPITFAHSGYALHCIASDAMNPGIRIIVRIYILTIGSYLSPDQMAKWSNVAAKVEAPHGSKT